MSAVLAPLWQISEELIALLDSVDTCPEELQPELQAQIDLYLGQEAAKTDDIAHVLAMLEYAQKDRADAIAQLQEEKQKAARNQAKLEAYVCRVMQARGIKKLTGKTNTLSVRPSDAVVITEPTHIPTRFLTTTVVMPLEMWIEHGAAFQRIGVVGSNLADKAAIKKALKAGEEIAGCDLEFRANLQRR